MIDNISLDSYSWLLLCNSLGNSISACSRITLLNSLSSPIALAMLIKVSCSLFCFDSSSSKLNYLVSSSYSSICLSILSFLAILLLSMLSNFRNFSDSLKLTKIFWHVSLILSPYVSSTLVSFGSIWLFIIVCSVYSQTDKSKPPLTNPP